MNFVCTVFGQGDEMLTLLSMEKTMVECNHKETGTRDGFPWIIKEIRRQMRKWNKLYKRMNRSSSPNDTMTFLKYKHR